jgi:threonine efflux protein
MSYLPQLLTLMGIYIIELMSPGPDFLATSRYAIARSRGDGVLVALGITSGNALWIVSSMLGLGILFAHVSWLINIVQIAGALFLIYLGIKTILSANHPLQESTDQQPADNAQPGTSTTHTVARTHTSSWRIGLLTNVGNPKALVFYTSIFAVLLPTHSPLWLQASTALLMLFLSLGWFSIVALLFSLGPISALYRRAKKWIDYVTGGIFVLLGLRLAFSR